MRPEKEDFMEVRVYNKKYLASPYGIKLGTRHDIYQKLANFL